MQESWAGSKGKHAIHSYLYPASIVNLIDVFCRSFELADVLRKGTPFFLEEQRIVVAWDHHTASIGKSMSNIEELEPNVYTVGCSTRSRASGIEFASTPCIRQRPLDQGVEGEADIWKLSRFNWF